MAEDIRTQQNPCAHTFLAELDEEMRKTEYTPPNTDKTLPVPTAVKAIAEAIRRQQYPRAYLDELRNKNKS
jgi:hypothetical protein